MAGVNLPATSQMTGITVASGPTGLGGTAVAEYPEAPPAEVAPIDLLANKDLHQKTLDYLLTRLNASERAMSSFYTRWNEAEKIMQIYVKSTKEEEEKKEKAKKDGPTELVEIVVPYAAATVDTIVTYLIHTFCGSDPMFQVTSAKSEGVKPAKMNEAVLQYQSNHTRMIKLLKRWFQDGEVYGLGVLRTDWKVEKKKRTEWTTNPLVAGGTQQVRQSVDKVVYEGNALENIDPYNFFPDPTVEMVEVNKKGEFVFLRTFIGKHQLLQDQAAGIYKYVDKVSPTTNNGLDSQTSSQGQRNILSGGDNLDQRTNGNWVKNQYQIDQGSVFIIPKELGLGSSEIPEMWVFTIAAKQQIIRCEKATNDHGMHPIAVIEPYALGYSLGSPALLDYISPIQNTMSWLINSHIFNVRSGLDNTFVVDPTRINIDDLTKKKPKGPRIVRLKNTMIGADTRTALTQVPVQDFTQGHVNDMTVFQRIGDGMSAVNDNLRGQNTTGGRRSATEARQSAEAGASRLAAHARLISATGVVDLTEQMVLNNIQYMSDEFYLNIVGQDGVETPMRIEPAMLVGDFQFPVHDGTLPVDKIALLEVWKEIFLGVSQNPQLSQGYNLPEMFKYIAKLSGAQNIDSFIIKQQTQPQIDAGVANGSLTPVPGIGAQDMMSALGGTM